MKHWLALVAVLGCQSDRAADQATRPARATTTKPAVAIAHVQLYPALRCSECHETMYKQWQHSAHARAAVAPLYVAMRAQSGDAATCDRCHSSLPVADNGMRAEDGVTCEGCHIIKDVKLAGDSAELVFELDDNRKFGPMCDAKKTYFHKTECSPLHAESKLCAGCHEWTMKPGVPVFTEYDEWAAGPYAPDTTCQDCHMPPIAVEVATGLDARNNVPHHGWLGVDGTLRKQAVDMRVTLAEASPRARLTVTLTNAEAGHKIPAGLPGKQLALRVAVVDASGAELGHEERALSRLLVDSSGLESPFYAATRVASDNRLAPNETREYAFELDAPQDAEIVVALSWRSTSAAIAERVKTKIEERTLLQARLRLGGRLPKTIVVKP